PEGIYAPVSRRDSLDGDVIKVVLDPYGTGRRGYAFEVNAAAVLRDALVQAGIQLGAASGNGSHTRAPGDSPRGWLGPDPDIRVGLLGVCQGGDEEPQACQSRSGQWGHVWRIRSGGDQVGGAVDPGRSVDGRVAVRHAGRVQAGWDSRYRDVSARIEACPATLCGGASRSLAHHPIRRA
ncbi:MAG: hypothetical protein QGG40_19080, partial [Myxococcota bacterium]|nr:hypothetical protein [Myxococcota bacterium]